MWFGGPGSEMVGGCWWGARAHTPAAGKLSAEAAAGKMARKKRDLRCQRNKFIDDILSDRRGLNGPERP